MIDLTTARKRVNDYLLRGNSRYRLVIVQKAEYDFGWVFYYDTAQYVATGDIFDALFGNAPIIVDRADGQLYVTGTAHSIDHYIAAYRSGVRRRAEPGVTL